MKKLFFGFVLLIITFSSCVNSQNKMCATNGIEFDSICFTDSMIAVIDSQKVGADYSMCLDYPINGDSSTLLWLRQWIALEVSGLGDTVPATEKHISELYMKRAGVYKGDLSDAKKMIKAESKKLFDLYDKEVVKPAYGAFSYGEDVNLRLVMQTPEFITYRFSGYSYRGGAHGMPYDVYTTLLLTNKTSLDFSDIFISDSLPKVKALISRGLYKYFEVKDLTALKELLMTETDKISSESSFPLPQCSPAFTEDGVVFVYQSYEIACYAAGQPRVVIPYKELWRCLRPEMQTLLKSFYNKA